MNKREQTIRTYDNLAEAYEQRYMDMAIYNGSYDLFSELIPESGEVFEIGTGPGNIAKYLLGKRPDLRLFGIDAAPAMVDRARKNNPAAEFEVMDCTKIEHIDRDFDGIISGFVVPYLTPDEVEKLIADSASLLKNNGVLYLSFVAGNREDSKVQTSSDGKHSVYFEYHPLEDIENQMQRNGFEIKHNLQVPFARSAEVSEMHNVVIAIHNSYF